ncbi:MAG: L,D-transpeptidase family protein [Patescibacteria group bacterium]
MKYFLLTIVLILTPIGVFAADSADVDNDGLSDADEIGVYFTDEESADTDNDGFSDGDEVAHGYSPRHAEGAKLMQVDSDEDYLNDAWELTLGTGLMDPDSDGDLYLDGTEVAARFDPLNAEPVQREKVIIIDLASQHLEYFFGDTLFGSFPISGGLPYTPTPTGEFTVLNKVPVKHYGGASYDYPNTQWNLHFYTKRYGYYIHGAYWHDDFGTPKSHGCVNVSYENMEPLYWWAQLGTRVIIQ